MKKIVINRVRNIEHLEFVMPAPGVSIITGKNGSGKTTLFACISRICDNNAFRKAFPASNVENFDVFSGSITYFNGDDSIEYTKRRSGEWRPNKQNNVLKDFNYPSVISITTNNQRIFLQDSIIPRRQGRTEPWMNTMLNKIFNTTKFADMINITTGNLRGNRGNSAESRRRNSAYAIPLSGENFYTERNFSFGEIVLINLLYDIKNAPINSLILIDEIELALHPSAQIELINCLRSLASEKHLTIILSTHSASIIRSVSSVILLEQCNGYVNVIYKCPPAKSIGAIGLREDTVPDVIVLVEDTMAKSLFKALLSRYYSVVTGKSYTDIRIITIGGFANVVSFYFEAKNYIFYNNIHVVAYMDKDVETDIIPYIQYGNTTCIQQYRTSTKNLKFLPYTPEVLLMQALMQYRRELLEELINKTRNQQIQYEITDEFDFDAYYHPLPPFADQGEYNTCINSRGQFRTRCKNESERIAMSLADQTNETIDSIYSVIFEMAITSMSGTEMNIREILGPVLNRG